MHAHELDDRPDLFRHPAQLQVPALGVQRPEARQEGTQAGTVDETQPAQVEHDLGIRFQYGCQVALELRRVAGIEFLHRHNHDGHVADSLDRDVHGVFVSFL